VYTPWGNLKKTASMDVGQVGSGGGGYRQAAPVKEWLKREVSMASFLAVACSVVTVTLLWENRTIIDLASVTSLDPAVLTCLQVGFHDERCRRYTTVASKSSTVINRLEKSKQEKQPDLRAEKEVTYLKGGGGGGKRVPAGC
jgi:hypothetical protein